jgi:hypothetical protein
MRYNHGRVDHRVRRSSRLLVRDDEPMEVQPVVQQPSRADTAERDDGLERDRAAAPGSARAALRAISGPFCISRLVVFVGAALGSEKVGQAHLGLSDLGRLLTAGLNQWDAAWYRGIAAWGYARPTQSKAYFPLYPLLIRTVGFVTGDIYASVIISLVAFLVALFLLYRLVELDFAPEVATATVALVAFCPIAFFFSAIYTESLFLALTVGAIYAARREHWLLAGLAGAFASATRNEGMLVVLPIAIIYLYGPRGDAQAPHSRWYDARQGIRVLLPRYRLDRRLWPILLVPAGVLAYSAYLALKYHAGTAWITDEKYWGHQATNPVEGLIQGAQAAWAGTGPIVAHPDGQAASWMYGANVVDFLTCLGGLALLVLCIRRLPAAYSVYAAAAFVLPLTSPVKYIPLASFPRYALIIFPMFICAALYLVRRGWTLLAVFAGGASLLILTYVFAIGRWVA